MNLHFFDHKMGLSNQELDEKISRIQEEHSRDIIKLSSYCEMEFSIMNESIKGILLTLETNKIEPKEVSICRIIYFTNQCLDTVI